VPTLAVPPVVPLPPVEAGAEPPIELVPPAALVVPAVLTGPGPEPPAFDDPPVVAGVEPPLLCEQPSAENRHNSPDVAEIELNLIEVLRSIACNYFRHALLTTLPRRAAPACRDICMQCDASTDSVSKRRNRFPRARN